jgi:hypothetical protein
VALRRGPLLAVAWSGWFGPRHSWQLPGSDDIGHGLSDSLERIGLQVARIRAIRNSEGAAGGTATSDSSILRQPGPLCGLSAARNVSGFDLTYDVIPSHIQTVRAIFRDKKHPLRKPCKGCVLEGNIDPIKDKKIALTKVDAAAHSMGGVLVRWYTTEAFTQAGASRPRSILYPPAGGVTPNPVAAKSGFKSMTLERVQMERYYRRNDNFKQGDLGSVVIYGSPQRGSPFANNVIHDKCHDDRGCFTFPPLTLNQLLVRVATAFGGGGSGLGRPDAGAAIYDLSMGSTANDLFHSLSSTPVRVHAIGTTANSDNPGPAKALGLITNPAKYCPGFDETTSDRIVPIESQFANFNTAGPRIPGYWHNSQDASPELQGTIATLLIDDPSHTHALEELFDAQFDADTDPGAYPLECTPGI